MKRHSLLFSLSLTLIALAIATAPARAEVEVVAQLNNILTAASSRCLDGPKPDPDLQKFWMPTPGSVDETLVSSMNSECGSAEGTGTLTIDVERNMISGVYSASSSLAGPGGGGGATSACLKLVADEPLDWKLTAIASTVQDGDPDVGALYLRFDGMDNDGDEDFDISWNGTLEPGEVYILILHASAARLSRADADGGCVTMDGSSERMVEFQLEFFDPETPNSSVSMGKLKSAF
ncbi:hypothetical protein DRQ53_03130 [bacterium]|nr:MAG: hypothetical protein DRQ32_02920 [bacterium]RKZ17593.1 MAG: hypothetical protein DRQ53_03130 [bacterium]